MGLLDDTAFAEAVELRRLDPDRVLGPGSESADVQHFSSIDAAVAFAMERLSADQRKLTWIRAGDRSISHLEIERLYRQQGAR